MQKIQKGSKSSGEKGEKEIGSVVQVPRVFLLQNKSDQSEKFY